MPTISGVGKRSPASTTTIRPSYSTTVMFLAISPSPPRGSTRSVLTPSAWRAAARRARRAGRGARASPGPRASSRSEASTSGRRRPADLVAEQIQRGLRAGRAGGEEERLVDVAAARRRSRRGAPAPRPSCASRRRPRGWRRRSRRRRRCRGCARRCRRRRRRCARPSISCSSSAFACLTPSMCSIWASSASSSGADVGAGAAGDVVEQDRPVGGLRDLLVVAHDPARARACCSRA